MPKLSLILPCHGNAEVINKSLRKILHFQEYFEEILICHNGPGKPNLDLQIIPNCKFLHTETQGIGAGYKLGINSASSPYLLLSGADLPFGISDIKEWANQNCPKVAVGSKAHPLSQIQNRYFLRNILTAFFYYLRKIILPIKLPRDTQGSIFVSKEEAMKVLPKINSDDFFFSTEFLVYIAKSKNKIIELPVILEKNNDASSVNFLKDPIKFFLKTVFLSIRLILYKN